MRLVTQPFSQNMRTLLLLLALVGLHGISLYAQESKAICDEIDALMEQIKIAEAKAKVDDALEQVSKRL
jgi:hypothetical protein